MSLIVGRATNPRKHRKNKGRKSKARRPSRRVKGYIVMQGRKSSSRKRRSHSARRSYMHGARKRRSGGSRGKGPKLAGIPLSTLLIDSAMLAGGGYVADNVVDFVDEQVISRLGLEGPLVGVAKFAATAAALAGGTYLAKKAGGKLDLMPLVYGAVSQLGASAFEDITGMSGYSSPTYLQGYQQDVVMHGDHLPAQAALPPAFTPAPQSLVMGGYQAPSSALI